VVDQPRLGPTPGKRHLQRVDHQLRAHVLGHRPADDPLAFSAAMNR
jgi:hypothetical protein